jgi:hypothetical protein
MRLLRTLWATLHGRGRDGSVPPRRPSHEQPPRKSRTGAQAPGVEPVAVIPTPRCPLVRSSANKSFHLLAQNRDQRQPNRLTHFLVKCCLELGLTKWHGLDIIGRGSHGILRYGVVTYHGYLTPVFYTRFSILPSPHAEMLTTSTSTASQSNFSFTVILPLSRVICSPRPSFLSNHRHNGQALPCLAYKDTQLYKVFKTANLSHPSSARQATLVALCGFERTDRRASCWAQPRLWITSTFFGTLPADVSCHKDPGNAYHRNE